MEHHSGYHAEVDRTFIWLFLIALPLFSEALGTKYNQAWLHPESQIVIDAYDENEIDWKKMKSDLRLAGVIHRATIGLRKDRLYHERRTIAESQGYLWGAYHLGLSGDPIQQAEFFLKAIGDTSKVLLVLDLEDLANGNMMKLTEARQFLAYVYQRTGKIPVIYANHKTTETLNREALQDPLMSKTQLWYARFRSSIPDFPQGIWSTYFLWQFSSEINCKATGQCFYNVPGTYFDMDINVFYGSRQDLRKLW